MSKFNKQRGGGRDRRPGGGNRGDRGDRGPKDRQRDRSSGKGQRRGNDRGPQR